MSSPFRRIQAGIGVLLGVSLLTVAGYIAAGGNPLDAAYFVVITIFGVGFGEVHWSNAARCRGS